MICCFLLFTNGHVPGGSDGKVPCTMRETRVQSLGREDLLKKEMATHSSTLAWKIPWTEECGSPWGRKESDTTERHHSLTLFTNGHVPGGSDGSVCLQCRRPETTERLHFHFLFTNSASLVACICCRKMQIRTRCLISIARPSGSLMRALDDRRQWSSLVTFESSAWKECA